MRPALTPLGHPVVYLGPSGLACPTCATDDLEPVTWMAGEAHEACTGCRGVLWPHAHPTSYGVLDRALATLWDRYAARSHDTSFRTLGEAARTRQPIGWSVISGVYQRIEARMLSAPDPTESRWLASLHWEVRRTHTWLPGPVARTMSAKAPVEGEPVTILARQPNVPRMRVLLPRPIADAYPDVRA